MGGGVGDGSWSRSGLEGINTKMIKRDKNFDMEMEVVPCDAFSSRKKYIPPRLSKFFKCGPMLP